MRIAAGIAIGVLASFIALFVLTMPFSFVWALALIGELQGLPCGGFC